MLTSDYLFSSASTRVASRRRARRTALSLGLTLLASLGVSTIAAPAATAAGSTTAAITAFTVPGQVGTSGIYNSSVYVSVPFGTNLTALVATFTLSVGASVKVGGVAQVSGTTTNNFTSSVKYTVTGGDGTTQDWTVSVAVMTPITAYSVSGEIGSSKSFGGVSSTVSITVPSGTNLTALIATFTLASGASATVGGVTQVSGITTNNFTSAVKYTIAAANGASQVLTVTITTAAGPTTASITAFTVPGQTGASVIDAVAHTVAITVPSGTSLASLAATYTLTPAGASAKVGGAAQVSGTTANNFTSPVQYSVTASNGTPQLWTVTVTVARPTAVAITAFTVPDQLGGSIDSLAHTVAITDAPGKILTALSPTFTLSPTGALATVGGIAQVSGTTQNDFTSPVKYTLTATDGTTQVWTVTITAAATITAFTVPGQTGASDIGALAHTVTIILPFGTNLAALAATFAVTAGASVTVGGVAQVSGTTKNDFTSPLKYTVTAANGSTQLWTVTITTGGAIATFTIPGQLGASGINPVSHAVAVSVPSGTNLSALAAAFAFYSAGASATVGGVAQVSGTTRNNFTSPVEYTVTAANGSTQLWTVTITPVGGSTAPAAITSFTVPGQKGASVIFTSGSVSLTYGSVNITVPYGTNRAVLAAIFTLAPGASAKVGGVVQVSGVTTNNFTSPVKYSVTAADKTTQVWTVSIASANRIVTSTFGLPAAITSFTVPGQVESGIYIGDSSVFVTVPFGTNITALAATFTLASPGASATVGGVVQVSGSTSNNFTAPVQYIVTGAEGTKQIWAVTISTAVGITAFKVPGEVAARIADYDSAVYITVSSVTNRTALAATFTLSPGASAKVGGVAQIPGKTTNNFTSPVTYTVSTADGTSREWTVTIGVAEKTAADKAKAAKAKAAKAKAAKAKAAKAKAAKAKAAKKH